MNIHPTAIISPEAKIGKNVSIGPYSVIEADTEIGDDCIIDAHIKVARYTSIGARCRIYFGALIGEEPQDHRFVKGMKSSTEIGSDTVIREYVTIHRPPFDGMKTIIGNHVLLMAFVHIAHDVVIEDHVTMANHTALTGHVHIGAGSVLSGYIKIHQFCRIGKLAFVAADTIISQDIPPFTMLDGNGFVCGPNTVGLRRAGLDDEQRAAIRKAIKTYFFKGFNSKNAVAEIEKEAVTPEVQQFIDFVSSTERGIVSPEPKLVFRQKK
jgi:UDP-N-acetylglucosamine acyltransferase